MLLRQHLYLMSALFFAASVFAGEAPAPNPNPAPATPEPSPTPPDSATIEKLIRQLADHDFRKRAEAQDALEKVGLAAVTPLRHAVENGDLETSIRASRVVYRLRSAISLQLYKDAMQSNKWNDGLKEGHLRGPLMGRADAPELNPRGTVPKTKQPLAPNGDTGPGEAEGKIRREAGLLWLVRNQEPDGHWDALKHSADYAADIEHTSLALLALLGSGHTEKLGRFKETVKRGVAWLKLHQREDGAILPKEWITPDGITHALAGMALSEATGMANVADTKRCAQMAVNYACDIHQPGTGDKKLGFGRLPKSNTPDIFSTTLFVMHLKSAKVSGLQVDPNSFDGVIRFLDTVDLKDKSMFSLVPNGKCTAEATFLGALSRQFLGWKKEDLAAYARNADHFFSVQAGTEKANPFINWIGTIVVFQQGETIWENWRTETIQRLCAKEALLPDGAWKPEGRWAHSGTIFTTTTNLLSLTVNYSYLPMNKK